MICAVGLVGKPNVEMLILMKNVSRFLFGKTPNGTAFVEREHSRYIVIYRGLLCAYLSFFSKYNHSYSIIFSNAVAFLYPDASGIPELLIHSNTATS